MAVEVQDDSGGLDTSAIDAAQLIGCAEFVMQELLLHPADELAITLVDEARSQQLHEQWMGLAGPTDVMSFPMDELRPVTAAAPRSGGILGDIVLCATVASRQAAALGKTTQQELNLLLTHGILHLIGYDHAEPVEQVQMFAVQDRLVAAFAQHWQRHRNSRTAR